MGNRRQAIRLIAAAAVAHWSGAASAEEACRADRVELRGDWGEVAFAVELADTDETRARGLMFRTSLPEDAGMLFVYPRPRTAAFWMRNTLIPLDMLFTDASGTVRRVHHKAQPLDERVIYGGDGILVVLEINGGLARELGITAGSQMRHPAFDGDRAVWPC